MSLVPLTGPEIGLIVLALRQYARQLDRAYAAMNVEATFADDARALADKLEGQ
jgi:hypothetical protein